MHKLGNMRQSKSTIFYNHILPTAEETRAKTSWCVVLFSVLLPLVLLFVTPLSAAEILVVQSDNLKPYQQAVAGILETLNPAMNTHGPKSLLEFHVERVVLDREIEDKVWLQVVQEKRPTVIIAVGTRALKIAQNLENQPIVYLMVPRPEELVGGRKTVTGISMVVPPGKTLMKLHRYFPYVRRVAVLYHPEYSNIFIQEARSVADLLRYDLIEVPVHSAKDVPKILYGFNEKVEAMWMIPDPHVVARSTVQAFIDFSIKKRTLLLTFAEKYLEMGATFAVVSDNVSMGRDAAHLAMEAFHGSQAPQRSPQNPVAFHVFKNEKMLTQIAFLKSLSE